MSRYILRIAALCCLLSACVTINVYFPAAAAEKAADQIIEDVWGPSDKGDPDKNKRGDAQDALDPSERVMLAAAGAVLDLLIPAAHAQADLNVATPAVRQLTQSMEARHAQLKNHFDSGSIRPDARWSGGDPRSEPASSSPSATVCASS